MKYKNIIIGMCIIILLSSLTLASTPIDSFSGSQDAESDLGSTAGTIYGGSKFTAGKSYCMDRISLRFRVGSGTPNDIGLKIYDMSSSTQMNTLLGTANNTYTQAEIGGVDSYHNFTFTTCITLTNANEYGIVLETSDSGGGNYYFQYLTTTGTAYWTKTGTLPINLASNFRYNFISYEEDTPTSTYFTLTAKDLYDSTSINNITATINGTYYSTTNGTITTNILNSLGAEINIEVASNELGGYFNKTYNDYNVSSNLEAELFQSEVDLLAYEIVTTDLLTGTFKINGTLATTNNNYLKSGTYNLTFNKTGYYDTSEIVTVTPLFNGSKSVNNVYDSLLNVTLKNAYTLNKVQNFTGWYYDNDNFFNQSFNTTNYETQTPILKNRNYTVFVNSNDYSITDDNYKNASWNDSFYNMSFSLYTNNSILLNIYDEATGFLIIPTNITIILTGNASEETYYTITGSYFLEGLQDGNYTIKLTGGAYQLKTYVITVAERSTQSLNAYLSTNYSQSIFTILDEYSGASIESASFNMARLINASWVTVESKLSDITGRSQVNYLEGIKYRFTVSKTGYNTKVFDLDPILFSSYNVKLTPIQVVEITSDYSGIGLTYYPKYFYDDEQNSLTFTINDPSGSLTSYYINITYPNGTWVNKQSSGVNAVGETFNIDFNISDAGIYDRVTIEYGYDTTITSPKVFSYTYSIIGGGSSGHTFSDIKDNDYGMGIFEKILIATITVLLISGVSFLVAGITGSLILGLLSYGFFVYIQFIPLWTILISLFVGIIVLINKSR